MHFSLGLCSLKAKFGFFLNKKYVIEYITVEYTYCMILAIGWETLLLMAKYSKNLSPNCFPIVSGRIRSQLLPTPISIFPSGTERAGVSNWYELVWRVFESTNYSLGQLPKSLCRDRWIEDYLEGWLLYELFQDKPGVLNGLIKKPLASLVIKAMHIKLTMGHDFLAKHKGKEVWNLRAPEGEVK